MHIQDANASFDSLPQLNRSEIQLWRIELDSVADNEQRWRGLLSGDEMERAKRFRFVRDRMRFTATRAILRSILAEHLRCRPEEVMFQYRAQGKPALADRHTESDIEFNVSHSGGAALVALSRGIALGVDIEEIRPNIEIEKLAARFFSVAEWENLTRYGSSERNEAFFRCWTRKEAYLKAKGAGLSLSLKEFDVSLASNCDDCLLATRPDAAECSAWRLCNVSVGHGFVAAVCGQGRSWNLKAWD